MLDYDVSQEVEGDKKREVVGVFQTEYKERSEDKDISGDEDKKGE